MKRELCAAGLLLLLAAGSLWHLRRADRLTRAVSDSLDRAEQAARQEDYEAALSALEEARRIWQGEEVYTQIFFRHPDLDALQDAFSALEQLLRQEDAAWPAALELLRYRLETLNRMEHVSPGTVFQVPGLSVSSLESSSMKVLISLKLR